MKNARALMEPALTVPPELDARALADLLLQGGVDGACVVRDGRLLGVVTAMDLVFKEKKVHLPTMLHLLDAVIPMGSMRDVREELDKIAASTAGELMTDKVVAVRPETLMDEVATRMIEDHLSLIPVVEDGELLGVVTKRSLLRGAGLASAST